MEAERHQNCFFLLKKSSPPSSSKKSPPTVTKHEIAINFENKRNQYSLPDRLPRHHPIHLGWLTQYLSFVIVSSFCSVSNADFCPHSPPHREYHQHPSKHTLITIITAPFMLFTRVDYACHFDHFGLNGLPNFATPTFFFRKNTPTPTLTDHLPWQLH